jgi:hypothetical protein
MKWRKERGENKKSITISVGCCILELAGESSFSDGVFFGNADCAEVQQLHRDG